MAPIGNVLLVQRLATVTLFKLVRLFYAGIQRFYWELSGTGSQLRQARRPENYDRCAQVLDIRFRHKFCEFVPAAFDDFVCTHRGFVSPQYIIDNDHIGLMFIDDEYAVFSEAPEKGVHLWRSKYNSFVLVAQLEHTKRLIRVPLAAFHRMSETIGDPRAQIVFLFNVARCGSTLFTQVMECTERCVSVSEPASPQTVVNLYQRNGDSPALRQLARDVIRWECRPYQSMQPPPLAYVLKLAALSTPGLSLFRELFPESRCLFMYRGDVLAVAKSSYRVSFVSTGLRLLYTFGKLSKHVLAALLDSMGFDGKSYSFLLTNDFELGVVVTGMFCRIYSDMHLRDPSVRALRYEELVASPLETCRSIMEHCGLPTSLAALAVRGLEVDSQRSSILSRSIIGKLKVPEVTPDIRRSLDATLKKFNLPPVGENILLDGTLMPVR